MATPPPPPPMPGKSSQSVEFDWDSIKPRSRVASRKAKTETKPATWAAIVMLGIITACVLLATFVYVVIPVLNASRVAETATIQPPIAEAPPIEKPKAAPIKRERLEKPMPRMASIAKPAKPKQPAVILSANYWRSVYAAPTYSRYSGFCFRIAVQLKSQSSEALEAVSYHVRSIRPDRQVREYETFAPNVAIRGGLNPGETIEHIHSVSVEDLNGFNFPVTLPEGTVLQISIDGETWIEATLVDDPNLPRDPFRGHPNKPLGQ